MLSCYGNISEYLECWTFGLTFEFHNARFYDRAVDEGASDHEARRFCRWLATEPDDAISESYPIPLDGTRFGKRFGRISRSRQYPCADLPVRLFLLPPGLHCDFPNHI